MLVFHRIFNFDQDAVALMEQRLDTRYVPGAAFPLQGWLLVGVAETPAKILNISSKGIGLLLAEPAAHLAAGAAVRVRLRFGAHQQLVAGEVVHVRPDTGGIFCGVDLKFADFLERKTYLQLLQPIAIGQSLQAVPPERVLQEPEFNIRVFRGDQNSMLTVWQEKSAGAPVRRFEFLMQDYFCHGDSRSGVLEACPQEDAGSIKARLSHPVFDISGSLPAEIRQLFRWILPNLAPSVPADIRAFLQRYAT
ncbi:MAG: PilZ domain-containing protein [Lacunisphaera sp.]